MGLLVQAYILTVSTPSSACSELPANMRSTIFGRMVMSKFLMKFCTILRMFNGYFGMFSAFFRSGNTLQRNCLHALSSALFFRR
jgi:hypothetical protein